MQSTHQGLEKKEILFPSFIWVNCSRVKLDAEFYFARPYHSWERGANENTNGLIRQYIPKGTDFSELTDEMLAEIEWKLNHRPRKSLGYRTPLEYCKQLFNFDF